MVYDARDPVKKRGIMDHSSEESQLKTCQRGRILYGIEKRNKGDPRKEFPTDSRKRGG